MQILLVLLRIWFEINVGLVLPRLRLGIGLAFWHGFTKFKGKELKLALTVEA